MTKKTIAVIFGGVSSEHEISLLSATSVLQNIMTDKYEIYMLGITKSGRWYHYTGDINLIKTGEWECSDITPAFVVPDRSYGGVIEIIDGKIENVRIHVAFPVLHGKNGEDGTIQGLFELAGIPYVGCNVPSSAGCMDKAIAHTILDSANIPTAKWRAVLKHQMDDLSDIKALFDGEFSLPVFIKPANSGSSVGVSKLTTLTALKSALQNAFLFDSKVLIEQAIIGQEVECAVIGNQQPITSIVGEVAPTHEFYDYAGKYLDDSTNLIIPARISEDTSEQIRLIAQSAYQLMGCSGLARIDFFVKTNGDIVLNELNTIPGFTSISMFSKLFAACGIDYAELVDRLISLALERTVG